MIHHGKQIPRDRAQDLAWEAMECWGHDDDKAAKLCREALAIYPDCVDALHMLADIESQWERDFTARIREAIEAGRRELGEQFFRENRRAPVRFPLRGKILCRSPRDWRRLMPRGRPFLPGPERGGGQPGLGGIPGGTIQ